MEERDPKENMRIVYHCRDAAGAHFTGGAGNCYFFLDNIVLEALQL
jgi:hypothetical protein